MLWLRERWRAQGGGDVAHTVTADPVARVRYPFAATLLAVDGGSLGRDEADDGRHQHLDTGGRSCQRSVRLPRPSFIAVACTREASWVAPDPVTLPLPCRRYRLLFADRITLFLVDPVKRELWITVSKVRSATPAEIHSRATLAALAALHSRGRCLRCWYLATGRQGHASSCREGYCRTCCTDRRSCKCGRSVVGPTIQPGS